MTVQYVKGKATLLRDLELDERWLQERINEDPSILGLGDLTLIRREKRQVTGGKIDFLLSDPEEDTRYEVELMLGRLDESHIIRTIEYWDVERSKYPDAEHRAVIFAEDITNRFFNVISLLNRAVPLIAIQMTAVRFEDRFVLTFTKVLDVVGLRPSEEESSGEQKDRQFWEKNASTASLGAVDAIVSLIRQTGHPVRISYNQAHIAVGTTGVNFLWAYPRKTAPHCFFNLRLDDDERVQWIARLAEVGIFAGMRSQLMKMRVTPAEIKDHADLLTELLKTCESLSTRGA